MYIKSEKDAPLLIHSQSCYLESRTTEGCPGASGFNSDPMMSVGDYSTAMTSLPRAPPPIPLIHNPTLQWRGGAVMYPSCVAH